MRFMRMFRELRNECGLTAIELAVVVAILSVLAGLVAGNTAGMTNSARGSAQNTDVAEMQKAVNNFETQDPAAQYPVSGVVVSCADASAVDGVPAITDFTRDGLADLEDKCVQVDLTADFTTPDTPSVTKVFVPDFMQRAPKHASDSPAPARNGNSWLIDRTGTVKNSLAKAQY